MIYLKENLESFSMRDGKMYYDSLLYRNTVVEEQTSSIELGREKLLK